jgi:hypothetical protein
MIETREKINLTLRKQTIQDFIFKKRIKSISDDKNVSSLDINPEELDIEPHYKDFRISNLVITILTIGK